MNHKVLRCVRDRSGTAVIEFAILTPVFLLMLTGMLAYGLYFGAAHAMQQLAADAARTAIAALDDSGKRDILIDRYIANNAGAYLLIDPDRLTHSVRPGGSAGQYVVELRYDAADLPIWNLYPPLPLPARQLVYAATIREGGL